MKVVTLGEIMLRLSTEGNLRFVQSNKLDATYGGGEANVCVSLANYGHQTYFVTKLPKHEIGQSAVNSLRQFGVNTDYICRGGDRVGIYFLETGVSMRASQVIYDRADSAIATAKVSDFDFDAIMKGKDWFHWTGITPAISKNGTELVYAACEVAKKHKVKISCDLNFRKKLWTSEQAIATLTPLMKYVDVCIGNEEDADKCLGFKAGKTDVKGGHLEVEAFKSVCKKLVDKFGFEYVSSSMRESHSATHNTWSGVIFSKDKDEFYQTDKYEINPIVDRVGGGDSFASALIHGLSAYKDFKQSIDFAVAASALKHTIFGDFNQASLKEVETLMSGDKSGRVQR
ncbi:MAG: sugar kinase [Clostridiales bacterium]|jgi:2-dehydro-3-deoxygluconokinase|nr:sugar kinase [Clostridiales bacterium]